MKKTKFKLDIWGLSALTILSLYLLFLIWPMFSILKAAIVDPLTGAVSWKHFEKFFGYSYYFQTLINSFKVTIATTAAVLVIGIPLSYLYNMYQIRGKKLLQIFIILCSMSAPFIGAYAWIMLLGRSGIITTFLSKTFGIPVLNIYGFGGIMLVLTLQLFPLIFLYVSGAMKNIDNSLMEASLNMGCSGIKRFFKVFMPLIMPTVFAGGLLVFMRALADFGTPMLIGEGYRTFPVEIYSQYLGETGGNKGFAAAIAIVAVVITAVIFLIQKWLSKRYSYTMNALHTIEPKKARGIKNILIHVFIYGVVGIAFMPQCYVIYTSFKNTSGKMFTKGYSLMSYQSAFKRMGSSIQNTFIIGGLALFIIIILAVFIAYLVVRRSSTLTNTIDVFSMLPYIIPGSVVGIALVFAFNKKPLAITGTALIMIVALCIRRLPYTIRSSVAILLPIPITVEEAAISLGSSKLKAFFKITVPMMSNGIISGAILSWVTIITELSTAVILYTGRTMTLTIAIYTQVLRGTYGIAAAMSAILTALTIVSMLIFMRVSKNKEITL